ncbi:MAG: molybdopterin dinucleotide-binding protein, partial [Adlercreutzia equolifaciens]
SPYKLYGGICMSGDFMNQSNLLEAWDALTQLDFWVDINLWSCPNNGTADYVFPCTHWLETNTGRVSQGAGGIFGAGQRCVEPIGDVVFDPTFVVCLHKSMGVPFNDRDPEYDEWLNLDYHDFIQAGGSVGYEEQEYRVLKDATDWWKTEEYPDGPDFPQYAAKFQEEGWFDCRKWHQALGHRRWEMGYRRQQAGYNLYAAVDEKCAFGTPTGKVEIWSTICESYIGDTVTESYVLETPGTSAKVGEKTPYFAQVCSPDRDAYAGDIPDIDKFPHWFEPKNSRVQAPEWYDANLVDGASYNSDNYLNKPYHGIAGVGNGQATDNGTTDNRATSGREGENGGDLHLHLRRPPAVYFHSEHRQLPGARAVAVSALRDELTTPPASASSRATGSGCAPWGAIRRWAVLRHQRKAPPAPTMPGTRDGSRRPASRLVGISHHGQVRLCWICGASSCAATVVVYKPPRRTRRSATPCR